jgi:hypothetical protein
MSMKLIKLGHCAGRRSGLGLMLGAALVAVGGFSSGTAAQTLTTLYSFAGLPDGANPFPPDRRGGQSLRHDL